MDEEKAIKEYGGFVVGTPVICILNNRASLTVGKEYTIIDIYIYNGKAEITIVNDLDYNFSYYSERFLPKSEFRKNIINQALNNI